MEGMIGFGRFAECWVGCKCFFFFFAMLFSRDVPLNRCAYLVK